MASEESDRNPVEALAEEFFERRRQGERPSIDDYASRYPQWAEEIRDLFPALALMEDVGADEESPRTAVAEPSLRALEQLGGYRILREIGRGGMGVVYEAEQEALGRHVALKVLPVSVATDERSLERFRREARAAAALQHSNIVPVYDIGEEEGVFYYAMQFVRGQPLTEVLDELRDLRRRADGDLPKTMAYEAPSGASIAVSLWTGAIDKSAKTMPAQEGEDDRANPNVGSTVKASIADTDDGIDASPDDDLSRTDADNALRYHRSVARICMHVAHALEYAHGNGIIHRDIKPSNLLLDLAGNIWVTDFGLAKTDGSDLTQTGDVVGTIRYMAPERFRGWSDPRTDVYSLGITLYELLTLRPAFDAPDRLRLIHEVTHDTPDPPRKLDARIPRDLETVVLKAIDREPGQRYQTTAELAADLKCVLEDKPILARRSTPWEQLRRWRRRNRAVANLVALAAALLLMLTLGSAFAAVLVGQVAAERRVALGKAQAAQTAAEKARDAETALRKEAEEQRKRADANFAKARAAVDEYFTKVSETQLLRVPGLQPLRQELLASALTFYEDFVQERGQDPQLRLALAETHFRIGRIHSELGRKPKASAANKRARALFEALLETDDSEPAVLHGLARVHFFRGDHEKAVELCKRTLQSDPDHVEAQTTMANAYNSMALAKTDHAETLALHRQALDIREALVRREPENPEHMAQLSSTLNNIGVILAKQGKRREALPIYQRAVDYKRRVREKIPHVVRYGRWMAIGLSNVAGVQSSLGNHEKALETLEELVRHDRRLVIENPAIADLKSGLYKAYQRQAVKQRFLGREEDSQHSFRLAREILENLPRETKEDLFDLAVIYGALALPPESEIEPPNAEELQERRHYADLAIDVLRDAIEAGYAKGGVLKKNKNLAAIRDHEDFGALLDLTIANRLTRTERKNTGRRLFDRRRALRILEKLPKSEAEGIRHQITMATAKHSIGVIQTELKKYDEAKKSLAEAERIRRGLCARDPEDHQLSLDLNETLLSQGELDWAQGERARIHGIAQQCLATLDGMNADELDKDLRTAIVEQRKLIYQKYGELGLWEIAAGHGMRDGEPVRLTNFNWDARMAVVAAVTVDDKTFDELCRKLKDKWHSDYPTWVAWVLALRPQSVATPDEVVVLARAGVEKLPKNNWALTVLALALHRTGQSAEALQQMKEAAQNDGWTSFQRTYAMIHSALGDPVEARRHWNQAEAVYRDDVDRMLSFPEPGIRLTSQPWWNLAYDQILRRQAWDQFEDRELRDDPYQRLIQARAYGDLGEADSARSELAAAVSAAPENWWVRMHHARLLEKLGDDAQAEESWNKVVELDPNEPKAWIARARYFIEQGAGEKADADFEKAAGLAGEKLDPFLQAGWWVVGPFAGAIEEKQPLETRPDPSQPVESADGSKATWVHLPTEAYGHVNFNKPLGEIKDGSVYALAYVYSRAERDATLKAGGDEVVRLWCNGEVVLEKSSFGHSNSNSGLHDVALRLRPGRNALLVKVHNALANHDMHVRFPETALDEAESLADAGLWKEAVANYEEGLRQPPFNAHIWWDYATLLAATGQEERYQRLCEELLVRFAEDKNPWHALAIAISAGLGQPKAIDTDKLIERAETGVAARSTDRWFQTIVALAYYRAERFDEALAHLTRNVEIESYDLCWPLLAIIHHRLGNANEARQWFAKASQRYEEQATLREQSARSGGIGWARYLILHRQAHELIEGAKVAVDGRQRIWRAQAFLKRGDPDKAKAEMVGASVPIAKDLDVSAAHLLLFERLDESERAETERQHLIGLLGAKAIATFNAAAGLIPGDDPRAKLLEDQRSPEVLHVWNFATGSAGWKAKYQCVLDPSDGVLTVKTTGDDPQIVRDLWAPAGLKELTICARVDGRLGSQLFWTTVDSPRFGGGWVNCSMGDSAGQWREYRVFFYPDSDLVNLRLDPHDQAGVHVEFAWATLANRSLDDALESHPDDARLHAMRCERHVRAERWEQAGADLDKAVELKPGNVGFWYQRAALYLATDDLDGYRGFCQRLFDEHRDTEDAGRGGFLAWCCSLAPQAVDDLTRVVEIAERNPKSAPKSAGWIYAVAAMLYRAGRYEEALGRLNETVEYRGFGGAPWERLLLAMTHHRLGNRDEARKHLESISDYFDANDEWWMLPDAPRAGKGNFQLSWAHVLDLEHLRREAEELIGIETERSANETPNPESSKPPSGS